MSLTPPSAVNREMTPTPRNPVLLEIKNLVVSTAGRRKAYILDGVNLKVGFGETLGIVGESGCGKSTVALVIMGLLPHGLVVEGSILFDGRELTALTKRQYREVRGQQIAMTFQNPFRSLNPTLRIGDQIAEPLIYHRGMNREAARKETIRLLDEVEVPNAGRRVDDYPHQFSGGMQQRALIAIALSCNPRLLIADEPTTALDVTVQAKLLLLLRRLQHERGMSMLMISHDFGVIGSVADTISVMYSGEVMETASTEKLFSSSQHPYSRALLSAVPTLSKIKRGGLLTIPGQPPDLRARGAGCRFAPRCSFAIDRCRSERPVLSAGKESAACWVLPFQGESLQQSSSALKEDDHV